MAITPNAQVWETSAAMDEADHADYDTLVPIRHEGISCAETPFISYNLSYSGPCLFSCGGCHSKTLWETRDGDYKTIGGIMDHVKELFKFGIVNGLCILGTDCSDKEESAKVLVESCTNMGMPVVVYTGYPIEVAPLKYGFADFFVCGTYQGGEWDHNKKFYALVVGDSEDQMYYAEITKAKYFESNN